ncbi:MAG: NADH-quinone oxidoreductase subunit C [Gammaproteobacteria bacterium]|nr:NADH-quinone oxidoreductase subunit C [Gammaproteobacteria bacterium]
MSEKLTQHADALRNHFADKLVKLLLDYDEITIEVKPADLLEVATGLRDEAEFGYQQLADLCGVDYSQFAKSEWQTNETTNTGFSRGVDAATMGRLSFGDELEVEDDQAPRYASVMHLTSYRHNRRLRVKTFADNNDFPVVPSVTQVWASADWYEREAFDLYGILYSEHPDLRRILTDYGFVGHPFRKDFPLVGHVEMRYDPEQKRVIYEPVSIEPRVLVPRVSRDDHRYIEASDEVAE